MGETIGEEGSVREPVRRETSREHGQLAQRTGSGGQAEGQARKDMLGACRDSRHAGKLVEKLAENLAVQVTLILDYIIILPYTKWCQSLEIFVDDIIFMSIGFCQKGFINIFSLGCCLIIS